MTLGLGGLLVALTLALPAFRETADDDRLARSDLAVTFQDRYGVEVGKRGVNRDEAVPFEELPDYFVKAVIATEDRRFFNHFGIDVIGTFRALTVDARASGVVQGGSSITQQLAKNIFLSNERSIERKIKEAYLALWLEFHLTKKEILKLYLDRAYMGAGAFGVEAAAQTYFGKSARDIDLAEAAMLAGLFKAPTKFSPLVNLAAARARANDVLSNLVDAGFMTEGQVYAARRNPATPVDRPPHASPDWYLDFAYSEVKALAAAGKLGSDRTLTVRTGLDTALQAKAEETIETMLRDKAPAYRAHQAAAVVATTDGLVRAMVGGRDYGASQFNRATDAERQPGSSFKIFVYMTALMTGKFHGDTPIDASSVCIGDYCVHNYHGESAGILPLYRALAESLNTAAIRMSIKIGEVYWPPKQSYHLAKIAALGRSKIVETARAMGVTTPLVDTVSLPVGADEVKMIDMVARQRDPGERRAAHDALRGGRGPQRQRKARLFPRRRQRPAEARSAGGQGRGDERDHDPCRDRGHGARGSNSRPGHLRQDRHDQQFDQRVVQRLHRQSGRQRLVRQRRQRADGEPDRRHPAGDDLAGDHDVRSPGPRAEAAVRRRHAAAGAEWSRRARPRRRRPRRTPAQRRPLSRSRRRRRGRSSIFGSWRVRRCRACRSRAGPGRRSGDDERGERRLAGRGRVALGRKRLDFVRSARLVGRTARIGRRVADFVRIVLVGVLGLALGLARERVRAVAVRARSTRSGSAHGRSRPMPVRSKPIRTPAPASPGAAKSRSRPARGCN